MFVPTPMSMSMLTSHLLLTLPPLDAIRGFVAVAGRMSIARAAQDLCLTPSAVSRQVQALEEHFGTPLLIRRHRAIALTPAGEQLFALAGPWLHALAGFTESVRGHGRSPVVTVSASIGVASLWLLPRLGAFQAAYPAIDVRIAASNQMVDLRKEGVDLAIRYCPQEEAPDDALKLFDERMVPVASPIVAGRAFGRPDGLLDEVLIELDDRGRPWLRWSDWLAAIGKPNARPKAYLRFNHYDQVVQAAVEGHGVALGRLALVAPMLADGRLVAHGGLVATSPYAYWLVQTPGPARPEVGVLRDWIVELARSTG
jgi:LysR family glycine cleavage system transcriptional activator